MPASNSDRLNDILKRTAPNGDHLKESDLLPDEGEAEALTIAQMDGKYSSMRPANKPLTRLHVIHKDGKVESLQYHHLDAKSEFNGHSFVFLFSGAKLWELTVEGRNLWRMYDYISLCRWPYIRVANRDFDAESEMVTSAKIKEIEIPEPA